MAWWSERIGNRSSLFLLECYQLVLAMLCVLLLCMNLSELHVHTYSLICCWTQDVHINTQWSLYSQTYGLHCLSSCNTTIYMYMCMYTHGHYIIVTFTLTLILFLPLYITLKYVCTYVHLLHTRLLFLFKKLVSIRLQYMWLLYMTRTS